MERADGAGALFAEVVDLFQTPVPVPPQGTDYASRERPGRGHRPVGPQRCRRDPGVLPAGDPERMQVRLTVRDRRFPLRSISYRHESLVEGVGRSFLQRAARLAGGRITVDPPVRWIRRVGGDAGNGQRAAIDPRPVHVAIEQEHRPTGHDGIEIGLIRSATGKVLHRPVAAEYPRGVRVSSGVFGDAIEVGNAAG